ncbi:MAG: acyl-CoA thioesterase, partial [Planctomycetes bacterium]|nr:acyl-CoA thioesterase [Planctomycetota bacterium]
MRRRRWPDPNPRFVEARTTVRVRFHEVDSLRVVWHGHYLAYFEEGRVAFGREHGFDYATILAAGYVAPLVRVELDYLAPARYDDSLEIICRMHEPEGARVIFGYEIHRSGGPLLASGMTVQVFTDLEGELILVAPRFYETFLAQLDWRPPNPESPTR